MITYSQLGKNGRLGNQMFQYAALFSAGLTRGYSIGIPRNQQITEVFNLNNAEYTDEFSIEKIYKERDFSFDPSLFLIPDNVDIHGYFQSGRYFNHCQDALRKEFEFKQDIQKKAETIINQYLGSPLCSVHVRRGDYTKLSNYHTNLGANYYEPACTLVYQNFSDVRFLVFSDDPEWCKREFKNEKFVVVDSGSDAVDLCVMSKCPIHVIANSSFSWWAAWLSQSRAVVAPKLWFGPEGPKNWETVYQEGWVLV